MKRILFLLIILSAMTIFASAEEIKLDYFLPDTCNYNKSIPVPSSVLGYEVGDWTATPEKGVEHNKAVAAASDRVVLEQYGWTTERRPLYLVIISSPENIRNLDSIR